jgi:glutathione S-transferase
MIPIWRERGNQGLAVLNNYLEKNKFVTDHGYSVADIAVYGYTHLADEGGFELSQFKHITAWIARVQEQPGYLPIDQLLTGQKQSLAA